MFRPAYCCFVVLAFTIGTAAQAQNFEPITIDRDADAAQLNAWLDMMVELSVDEKPMVEVFAELSHKLGIPFYLNVRDMSEAGLGPDTPITINMPPVRLEALLNFMLAEQDLTWMPGNGGFIITTNDGAETNPMERVYPVYDLITVESNGKTLVDFDSLIKAIVSSIEPDKWEENGGSGNIEPFNGSLIIRQKWTVHRKIERLLGALRASAAEAPEGWSDIERWPNPAPANQNAQLQRRTYLAPIPASVIRTYE